MTVALAWLASAAIAVGGYIHRPRHVRCPPTWRDYDGVRPTGELTCAPPLTGPDWTPGSRDRSVQPSARLRMRVYCLAPDRPTVDWDGLGARCRR